MLEITAQYENKPKNASRMYVHKDEAIVLHV
jgi:hypothetical protein